MSTLNLKREKPVALIFGARSWIGYHLTRHLEAAGWVVYGTSSNKNITDPGASKKPQEAVFFPVSEESAAKNLATKLQPDVIINLLIGITDKEYAIHRALVEHSTRCDSFYVLASSALALDGYKNVPLIESLEACSISEYGQFKAQCEDLLIKSEVKGLVLRFSSIHGWSPYKATRTVNLLQKLRLREEIVVNTGVIQNRLTDQALIETVTHLIENRTDGVAHIGAEDCSEEIDFLRKIADGFGYSTAAIIESEPRPVNLAVIPDKGRHPQGAIFEKDTLEQLLDNTNLQQYKNQQ